MNYDNDALDEARAERSCSMGVGCGTAGACYAKAHGRPEECPNAPDVPQVFGRVPRLHPGAKGVTVLHHFGNSSPIPATGSDAS